MSRQDIYAAARADRPVTVRQLAVRFGKLLRQNMSAKEYRLVVHRNRKETQPSVCHSHDFCDSNMVMRDALLSLGFSRRGLTERMCNPGATADLWMDAWNLWIEDPWIGVSWRKAEERRYRMMRWRTTLDRACRMMEYYTDTDAKVALTTCAQDECIPGADVPAFIEWAEGQLTTRK